MMQLIRQGIVDPLLRARLGWLGCAYLLSALLLSVGMLYLIGGGHVIVSTPAYVIFEGFLAPIGGLHAHGGIMVALGLWLLATLQGPTRGRLTQRKYSGWVFMGVFVYFGWTAAAFALAPLDRGVISGSGVLMWGILSLWPLIMRSYPPPIHGVGEDARLLDAASRAGIDEVRASTLVRIYLHEGGHGAAG